jgi:dihydroorotate dehydrogenase (NAD+) catalytic subunit
MLDLGTPPHRLGLASCPFEVSEDLQNFAFVTLKSCSLEPITGPCLFTEVAPDTFMNRWGLDNPGVEAVMASILPAVKAYQSNLVLSAFFSTPDEVQPFFDKVPLDQFKAVELNLSCPNRKMFTFHGLILQKVRTCIGHKAKLGLKIGPLFPKESLKSFQPDFVTFSNTKPAFHADFGLGGQSGAPLKDIVRQEFEQVRSSFSGSLILCGGVKTAQDYLEYLNLGADYVALASQYLKDREVVFRILSEI